MGKMATELAVERAKLDAVQSKLPGLRLDLREATPSVDRSTKKTAEAENEVARLQRLNQITKKEMIELKANNDMITKRVKLAEQKYAVEVASAGKTVKQTKKLKRASKRLRQRIALLEASRTNVADKASAEEKAEQAALMQKMKQAESALSPEQLQEKEKEEEEKLAALRKEAIDKDAEASDAQDELQPDWALV